MRTRDRLAERFGVNVLRIGRPKKGRRNRSYWVAYRGGNGTGVPVVSLAEAFTLDALARRLERAGVRPDGAGRR